MNEFNQKSFWHDQTCEPIKISVLRMRVILMMFHRIHFTKKVTDYVIKHLKSVE